MAWLQEIPKGSGRFYVYWRNPDTGKNEYLRTARSHEVTEHQFAEMFKEKFEADGRESNAMLTDFMFESMKSKSENLEKLTKKEVTVTQGKKDNQLDIKMGSRNFAVAFGGDVFFTKDKGTGLLLPVVNPTKPIESNTVYVTFGKQFFMLNPRDQTKVIAEMKRSFNNHPDGPLKVGNVNRKFGEVDTNGMKLFQDSFYGKLS
jgi:hypothetical protein